MVHPTTGQQQKDWGKKQKDNMEKNTQCMLKQTSQVPISPSIAHSPRLLSRTVQRHLPSVKLVANQTLHWAISCPSFQTWQHFAEALQV